MKTHLIASLLILAIAHPVHAADQSGQEAGAPAVIRPKFRTNGSSQDPTVKNGARIALGSTARSAGKAAAAKAAAEDASMGAPAIPRARVIAGHIQKRPATPAALAKQQATALPKTALPPKKHALPQPAASIATIASPGMPANMHHAQPAHSNGLNAAAPVQPPNVPTVAFQQPKILAPLSSISAQSAKTIALAPALTQPAHVFKPAQAAQSLGGPVTVTAAHHSANPAMIGGTITPPGKRTAATGLVALGRL
jgi:hypothetical protein